MTLSLLCFLYFVVDDVEKGFSLDAQDFQEKFGVSKPPLDSHELVFHCQMGRRGCAATEKARSLGFSKYDQDYMCCCVAANTVSVLKKKRVHTGKPYFN